MEPQEITQAEAADLLATGFETGRYEPLGLFLVGEAGGTWTGIDNSTGNAWTEEFGTQAECLKWLKERMRCLLWMKRSAGFMSCPQRLT